MILFLIIVVIPSQPKIRIMTAIPKTVLRGLKEPGGTALAVIPLTWTVCIIMARTHLTLMVSTGQPGKDLITPPRELKWKSDQWTFKTFFSVFFACLLTHTNKSWKTIVTVTCGLKITKKFYSALLIMSLFSRTSSFLFPPYLSFPPFPSLILISILVKGCPKEHKNQNLYPRKMICALISS